jgi:hypothetical protein
VLKLAASFKDMPKERSKHYGLKDPKYEKNQKNKKNWVAKEKAVEEKQVE